MTVVYRGIMLAGMPMLIAAANPEEQAVPTSVLALLVVAIGIVILLRGVMLRKHVRRRRDRGGEVGVGGDDGGTPHRSHDHDGHGDSDGGGGD